MVRDEKAAVDGKRMRGVEAIPGDDPGDDPGDGGAGTAGPASGTLILAATPIGRPEDASARLVAALATAPVIAAEDTRRLRRLADRLGVETAGNLVSYWEEVEQRRGPELLAELRAGRDVLL